MKRHAASSRAGVAVMAGGLGLRLADVTSGLPKALAPFDSTTLLEHQLRRVAEISPSRVVVLGGHGGHLVRRALDEMDGIDHVELHVEETPMGTAGALHSLPPEPDRWLVLNVDHISDVDLPLLVETHEGPCTAVITRVPVPVDEGVVELEGDRLVACHERPVLSMPVSTGCYVFSRDALATALDGGPRDMPELLQRLVPQGVRVFLHESTWFDAGTPERLRAAERWWRARLTGLGAA